MVLLELAEQKKNKNDAHALHSKVKKKLDILTVLSRLQNVVKIEKKKFTNKTIKVQRLVERRRAKRHRNGEEKDIVCSCWKQQAVLQNTAQK